jgi:hypothetical protein
MNARAEMLAAVRARLAPHGAFTTPASIAAALDVPPETVHAWIQSGDVDALDLGAPGRPAFKVFVPSLFRFLAPRSTRKPRP